MSEKVIAFFSSDARELYKADIYRALALPAGYVLHFRYLRKYIEPQLLSRINKLNKTSGIIFFVAGNDNSADVEQRHTQSHSIRKVTIQDVEEDLNIDTVHFYLQLGDFVDTLPHNATDAATLPPQKFVSEISTTDGPHNKWVDRVKAIADHFQKLMFIFIDGIDDGKQHLHPTYDTSLKSSAYELKESSTYQCKVTFYDPGGRGAGLVVENTNSSAVEFISPKNHRLAAERDTTVFEVQTHGLSQRRLVSFTHIFDRLGHFNALEDPEAWRVELKWGVTRSHWSAILFGIVSSVALTGAVCANLATDDLTTRSFSRLNVTLAVVGIALVGASAGYLFAFFNKK